MKNRTSSLTNYSLFDLIYSSLNQYLFGYATDTYFATLRPLKNLAMSWSEDCQGRPRARTMQLPSISSSFELQQIERTGYLG